MYKLRLGKSVGFCSDNYYETLDEMVKNGFDSGDFDIASKWHLPEEEAEHYKTLEKGLDAFQKSGLYLNGVHISFGKNWDISAVDDSRRQAIVEKILALFARINPYNPHGYILHGSFEPIPPENRAAQIQSLKKSLTELCNGTKSLVCVEILPRTCLFNTSKEAIEVVDSLPQLTNLKVCVDVNHYLQERAEEGVLALGSRIATTHISDHDYEDERHWLPMKGKIDWNALLAAFEKIGYQGVFNYEVGATCAEVKQNYETLFAAYNAQKAKV